MASTSEKTLAKVSLTQRNITTNENGVIGSRPALSNHWITSRTFTRYYPLPIVAGKVEESSLQEWLSEAEWYKKDLIWLLRLEHNRFWSHMVYEPACIVSVTSFLQEAMPYYIPVSSLTSNKDVLQMYKDILTLTLSLLYRLLTERESETEWMSASELGDIIYTNYIVTIPMAMDMLIAYGRSNIGALTELFNRIFSFNERYASDLTTALRDLEKSFQIIQQKCDENDTNTSFDDLATFTLDCCATVGILLTTYPPARQYALEIKLEQCITNFYDVVIPKLYQQIHTINPESKSLEYLNESRMELLGSFLQLSNYYLEQILNEPGDCLKAAESFLAILQEALSDQIFIIDYQRLHPVASDIEILQQACPELDMFKVDYILNAYISGQTHPAPMKNGHAFVEEEEEVAGAMALPPSNSNSNEQIQEVLNIFPHLTTDFVEKLLQRYESTEKAIAEYLEGNLPPDLIESDGLPADEFAQRTPSVSPIPSASTSHAVNDDKFLDQFNFADNSKVIVKMGKGFPGGHRNASSLLDDKSHIRSMKDRYESYGLVVENENEYDDEYDDSYDGMTESESKSRRKAVGVNAKDFVVDEDDEDDGEEEEEEGDPADGNQRDRSKDFCENPEVIRERLAKSRYSKFVARGTAKPKAPSSDVAGSSKDSNTQQNRHKKDVNKSTRANHNRRQGAAFKRNRGMIPS
ncbi:hypothetical protein HA402_006581 [Bradysia odoriphaga]|nr:hypothetical protein HA402_006581 [Bradysia odoriphaga]